MSIVADMYRCTKCNKILGSKFSKCPYCEKPHGKTIFVGKHREDIVKKIHTLRESGLTYWEIGERHIGMSESTTVNMGKEYINFVK